MSTRDKSREASWGAQTSPRDQRQWKGPPRQAEEAGGGGVSAARVQVPRGGEASGNRTLAGSPSRHWSPSSPQGTSKHAARRRKMPGPLHHWPVSADPQGSNLLTVNRLEIAPRTRVAGGADSQENRGLWADPTSPDPTVIYGSLRTKPKLLIAPQDAVLQLTSSESQPQWTASKFTSLSPPSCPRVLAHAVPGPPLPQAIPPPRCPVDSSP